MLQWSLQNSVSRKPSRLHETPWREVEWRRGKTLPKHSPTPCDKDKKKGTSGKAITRLPGGLDLILAQADWRFLPTVPKSQKQPQVATEPSFSKRKTSNLICHCSCSGPISWLLLSQFADQVSTPTTGVTPSEKMPGVLTRTTNL